VVALGRGGGGKKKEPKTLREIESKYTIGGSYLMHLANIYGVVKYCPEEFKV
jgi:hypothetical protein